MKIVHSIGYLDFQYGGPVRAIIDLSESLAKYCDHEVRVMTFDTKDAPREWSQPGANPTAVTVPRPARFGAWFDAAGKDAVREAIRDADIVHIHGIWMPHQSQVARIATEMGKPYVISCRGMLDEWCMKQRALKKQLYLKFARGSWMLNNAALVHCTAEDELRQSRRWFSKVEGVVIPNLLNLEPFENMPDPDIAREAFPFFDRGDPVLLYLSRLHYKKGVEHLIRAVKLLRDEGSPHRLLIAGGGDKSYEASLKSLTTELALEDHVAFLGQVVGHQKLSLYRAADLFVLPTSQENFGFVIYESLASGTTVLTTKGVDTWPELHGQAGVTICEQRDRSIADSIKLLTGDKEALEAKGRMGRAWIFDQMHPERIIQSFHQFYTDAFGGRVRSDVPSRH